MKTMVICLSEIKLIKSEPNYNSFIVKAFVVFIILQMISCCSNLFANDSGFDQHYKNINNLVRKSINLSQEVDSLIKSGDTLSIAIYSLINGKQLIDPVTYKLAKKELNNALKLFSIIKCEKGVGYSYFYLARIAEAQNNDQGIIFNYKNAIKFFYLDKFNDGLILCNTKLATFYSRRKISILAKKHYNDGLVFFNPTSKKDLEIRHLLNFAAFYTDINEVDSALAIYSRIENQYNNQLSKAQQSRLYNNIAVNLKSNFNFDEAKKYYKLSLKMKSQLQDTVGIINTQINLLDLSILNKDIESSKQYYDLLKKTKLITDSIVNRQQMEFLDNEIDYIILTHTYDSLSTVLNNYIVKNREWHDKIASDKLIEMQKSFEIKERDQNIALLQKEDELKTTKLKQQKALIYFILGAVLLAVGVGIVLNRQRKKLKRSKDKLEEKQGEINTINQQLQLSNQAKDRMLSIIGHDLRGPIGGLKELINLYMEMPGYEEKDFQNLLIAGQKASTGAYHLLDNLLTWANSQRGEIEFNPVEIPLSPLVKQSVQLLDGSINKNNIQFEYQIPQNVTVTADLNMLQTILRNLLSNAIKYSTAKSFITICISQNMHETTFSVADQGQGMSARELSQLFEKKETFYIDSGHLSKGTGLGLILCKEFVELHKGRIWADSKPDQGTIVYFTIAHELPQNQIKSDKPNLAEMMKQEKFN